MAKFEFQSIYVKEDNFTDTETSTWIGKHVPISVSFSSSLVEGPIFLRNSNYGTLIGTIIDALD